VYLRQSQALVEVIKEKLPETELRFTVAKGHDHAFDVDPRYWSEYAESAMAFVTSSWLE
jgi:dienelactone hydrolase